LLDANGRIFVDQRSARWVRAIIPILAARLADRLELGWWEDYSPPTQEVSGSTTLRQLQETRELITTSQWRQTMELIAGGVNVTTAIRRAGIPPMVFRRFVRVERRLRACLEHYKRYARRRRWPMLTVEEILEEVATTNVSLREAVLKRGYTSNQYKSLVAMSQRNPELEQAYLKAKDTQKLMLADGILDFDDAGKMVTRARWRDFHRCIHRINQLRPQRLLRRANRAATERQK
jgi:hypothetical protein